MTSVGSVGKPPDDATRAARHPARWSPRRRLLSAAALLVVLAGAVLLAWRASLSPLRLGGGAAECAGSPDGSVDTLFGLSDAPMTGVAGISILRVDASSSGARAPLYRLVPVTGDVGIGAGDTGEPPPHWADRAPAVGATLRAGAPVELVVEIGPRDGHALLTAVRVTCRTPDGFIHEAPCGLVMEVDTTGRCARSIHRA